MRRKKIRARQKKQTDPASAHGTTYVYARHGPAALSRVPALRPNVPRRVPMLCPYLHRSGASHVGSDGSNRSLCVCGLSRAYGRLTAVFQGNATVDQSQCDPFSGCEWFGSTIMCQAMDFCGFPTQPGCTAHTGCAWDAGKKECSSASSNNNPYNDYDNVCQISPGVRVFIFQGLLEVRADPREQGACQPRAMREQPGRQRLPVEARPRLC